MLTDPTILATTPSSRARQAVAARTITVDIPYTPRPLQRVIHEQRKRFTVVVCHRRFGKTVCAINEMIRCIATSKNKRPRYAYIAPTYKQAKAIAWDYLKYYSSGIPRTKINESELRCDFANGGRVVILGAENPDAIRGIYLDGVILDEYGYMDPRVWSEIVRPALVDRNGWVMFIGTPCGRNHFWDLYRHALEHKDGPTWSLFVFKASETGIIPASELEEARSQMTPEEYAQEFECSFEAGVVGAYYSKIFETLEGLQRITKVPWVPNVQVHTAWDLGMGDSTAIWFCQRVGAEVRIIDFEENSGESLDYYARLVRSRPYVYGDHIFPHDVRVNELGTGKSRYDMLCSLGIVGYVLPPYPVEDGIAAVRMLLPQCWFDREKTKRGVEALRNYRRDWIEKNRQFRLRPVHDWTSHAADAFRYLALGLSDADYSESVVARARRRFARMDYNLFGRVKHVR